LTQCNRIKDLASWPGRRKAGEARRMTINHRFSDPPSKAALGTPQRFQRY